MADLPFTVNGHLIIAPDNMYYQVGMPLLLQNHNRGEELVEPSVDVLPTGGLPLSEGCGVPADDLFVSAEGCALLATLAADVTGCTSAV